MRTYFIPLLLLTILCTCGPAQIAAQTSNSDEDRPLTYFLPELNYDPAITTPKEFLGWQVGDWHVSHDLQQAYMRLLASESDRMTLEEIGKTYEDRPLLNLIVTSPENSSRLEEMREMHEKWNMKNGGMKSGDLSKVPAVLYQGFSIHGNEPSGGNAALMVAYYLAAAPYSELAKLLDNNIILFDPCYNPDGFNRFASWVNSHKNKVMTSDGNDREYNEAYPRGRTNHYWFDLNRDWLPVQHPESRARIKQFHEWQPNVLTDHHEMGKDATFFFMPGEPTRIHPMTPKVNQELTAKIGEYHAEALDEIGSLYYSGEGYDDFYYGKGSTYPDINGCVGILFEQASSRGHLQETENGLMDFAFTVRNQVATALSTHKAFANLRDELLTYQREFNHNGVSTGGYVVDSDGDPGRARELMNLIERHDVNIKQQGAGTQVQYWVEETPFTTAVFEPILKFEDSLFYDVSTFVLPYAFNLPAKRATKIPGGNWTDYKANYPVPMPPVVADYAYLIPPDDYYSPKAIYYLLAAGVNVKVSDKAFAMNGKTFAPGTAMVPVANNQTVGPQELTNLILDITQMWNIDVAGVDTGSPEQGLMLGSRSAYQTLRKPEIALIIEGGANSLEVADTWHLLDQRFGMPVTKLPQDRVGRADLSRYNTIIMVDGNYSDLGSSGTKAIQEWMGSGNVLITLKNAGRWAAGNGLSNLKTRSRKDADAGDTARRPYSRASRDRGGKVLGGSIYEAEGDLTHPLMFGMKRTEIPMFKRGNTMFEMPKNLYASPLVYRANSLLSGYSPRGFEDQLTNSAAIVVSGSRGGRTISFADNPNFRAFWYGSNRLFMNAIMFGNTISRAAVE
ncbi:zinc carboxypeptidase [Neolewinella aurantiaca]|uniref:Zinc carboxypeptidase n=1 Tax=Neolewinella aurantiaca TaxID=2602767 RepID=A0A5C7FMV5_9BACT|nr:M14 family zinc carboxypeptidase [Neolewinella aurantiaca]TXF91464.1 zinc carboxypeptidase [Neolewinella aurantiaca]